MIRIDQNGRYEEARDLPEEAAIALSINGSTHAVMMGTPEDLGDFAVGFLLTDGVIQALDEIENIAIEKSALGFDVQIRLISELGETYRQKRRMLAGLVGCGLCGIESLEQTIPTLAPVTPVRHQAAYPWQALDALSLSQEKRAKTGAIHGAALIDETANAVLTREDIGRHNALDKLIGAALRENIPFAEHSVAISSRVSLDLVIKIVRAGIGTLIARSTPSDLAVQYAKKWGLELIAPVFADEYFLNGDENVSP